MKAKIIGVIITAVLCAALIVGGIGISVKNGNTESSVTEEFVPADTTSIIEGETNITDNDVVFDTESSDNNRTAVTSVSSDNGYNTSTSDDRIYVEDDSVFSGGYFEWR